MSGCDQEMCPMWDGHGCPCAAFDLDRDDLPTEGVFTRTTRCTCNATFCGPGSGHESDCGWVEAS